MNLFRSFGLVYAYKRGVSIREITVCHYLQGPHVYLIEQTHHSTFAATRAGFELFKIETSSILGMYSYLAPQGNIYGRQYEANKMIFVRTKETVELALKWSVSLLYPIERLLGSSSVLSKGRVWFPKEHN